ncbi:PAS domain S-box protein [Sphingorhabdus soli]|uniref:histidine kinase n=2 Tax=Flavisphingopyxis soli TaxID=2601267 RepID=A0A5C6UQE8_9SPHN|nr:PAS domain S-box protein [Sphingorhabdus soli]
MPDAKSITSERLGRIVEDSASEIYVFSAEDFTFSLVNRGARENLGFSMDELRERTPWDIKPEFSQDEFLEFIQPLVTGAKNRLDFETVHERKDGSLYDVVVRLQLIRSDGEAVFFAAIEDTSERKAIERSLREVTVRLDAILGNTTMAVFMLDDQQHCAFMNKAAEQLSGYSLAETRGRPLHDVLHHTYPDGRPFPIAECAIDRAFPENNQTQGEEVFVHKDGSFYPVAFTASPMKDGTGQTVGTVIEAREISEELKVRAALEDFNERLKLRVEEEIEKRELLQGQLVQSQKMEAVGQLTGGVAHDFNNLLQVIGGNLQLLQRELPEDDLKQQARVTNALSGVARGAKLAAQLLAFGRKQPLEPRPIDAGRMIREMDDMLRRTLGEAIDIETVISGGLWNCLADQAQLENVILNLAINSRDAMESRGKLTIEAGNASLDDDYAGEHHDVSAGQYVMLAVTDTGKGIAPDDLEKVFEPFFTTKPPGEGTGLGLSMVYGFVKQSGGHIKFYSELGQGTTIRVYLPRTREEEVVAARDASGDTPGGDEVVLVVEDDGAVRQTTVELLGNLGYSVLEASNADNGMAIVDSGMKIDLLFTDVVMPGTLASPDLARQAKARLPDLAVLFTSGYTQNAIVHAGRLDDGVELISKPFTRERLARKIRQVLDARDLRPVPAAARSSAGIDAVRTDSAAAGAEQRRILLVEDEPLIRMTTAEMLGDLGYIVVEAGTVAAAQDRLANESHDILIADLGLPDGSGQDLIRHALDQYPEIAVIVASGGSAGLDIADYGAPQRLVILDKPFNEQSLKQALDSCLGEIAGATASDG